MPVILSKIIEMFVDKKRVIGWLSAIALAVGAAFASMQTQEFKDAVCAAPVLSPVTLPVTK